MRLTTSTVHTVRVRSIPVRWWWPRRNLWRALCGIRAASHAAHATSYWSI